MEDRLINPEHLKSVMQHLNGAVIDIRCRSARGLQAHGLYRSVSLALSALAAQSATFQTEDDYLISATIYDMRTNFVILRYDTGKTDHKLMCGDYSSMGINPSTDTLMSVGM